MIEKKTALPLFTSSSILRESFKKKNKKNLWQPYTFHYFFNKSHDDSKKCVISQINFKNLRKSGKANQALLGISLVYLIS